MLRYLLPLIALGLMGQVPDTVRVTLPAMHQRPLVLAEGQRLQVALQGNPTTGYAWQVVATPECLTALGDVAYVQDPADEKQVGVGGRFLFNFRADKKGTGTLRFVYKRTWENEPPLESASLTVEVR